MSARQSVLEVRGLSKTYTQGRWWQRKLHCRALDNVSFTLRSGTTLGIVGKSGSGKTTLAMCIVGLEQPDEGQILLNGKPRHSQVVSPEEIQLVFQDSAGALNPRMSALEIIAEPLLISKRFNRTVRLARVCETMERVGISPAWKDRLPHEFSGGQRQRLAIARALILEPQLLILDEVFVGLDLSIRGQIANLLLELQGTKDLSYICISHDLAFVHQFADAVAVMDRGRLVHTTPEQFIELGRGSDRGKLSLEAGHGTAGAAVGA